MILPEVSSGRIMLSVKKDVFPSLCRQVFAHRWSLVCWCFLSVIVGSLPYHIKHLGATAAVICCYINETELN